METVTEVRRERELDALVHAGWRDRWPWLLQGITSGGDPSRNLGLFGDAPTGPVQERWERLRESLGATTVVHARQPHGRTVRLHGAGSPGLKLAPPCDGHLTRAPGVALAISVADCVPVYLVHPQARAVGVVHAGWRGAAAGILERAVGLLADRFGVGAHGLHLHLGPSICGDCYEVGPEVHRGLGLPAPAGPEPVDLRGVLVRRAGALGIPDSQVSRSALCTLCGDAPLFSHRDGDASRQMAFIGLRSRGGSGAE